jgi:hopanoid biosynthesis associated RND transporter like protein HpnN
MAWWEAEIVNRPWWLLALTAVATLYCTLYTMDHLTVDTDTADMISIELPFQQNRLRLERAFPQDVSTILLVVNGETPEQTSQAVDFLGEQLSQDKQNFKSVYLPGNGGFFAKHGLLYMDLPELENLGTQLANAQPFIGRISQNPSLDGFFGLLGDTLKMSGNDLPLDLAPLLGKIGAGVDQTLAGQPGLLSWQQLMMKQKSGFGTTERFVIVTPNLDFNALLPAEKPVEAVKRVKALAQDGRFGPIQLRMTGEVVLEHEELDSITQGTAAASVASMILVFATLLVGYRSPKLVIATVVTLSIGLVFSLYFAAVAIGHLNLISIGFAVLFIGMGDAYSSHFCLRYRELMERGMDMRRALLETLSSTGSALILCTFTASMGLFAFLPTNYVGVSELGIIAGVSMFIALGTTFTVLPALLKVMPLRTPVRRHETKFLAKVLGNWPLTHARKIRWLTYASAVVALVMLQWLEVDFSPVNLRDPNSESVKTFKSLLQSEDTSPMTLAALARSEGEVRSKQAAFGRLPSVRKTVSLLDFVPADQEQKLAQIEELGLILGGQLDRFPARIDGKASAAGIKTLLAATEEGLAKPRAAADQAALEAFRDQIKRLNDHLAGLDEKGRQALLQQLQNNLLGALPQTIGRLRDSLEPEEITLAKLPADVRERWLSNDGWYRLQIFPKKDGNDLDSLREFIAEAQTVDANVTDLPVTYLESMNEVIRAFVQAFSIALVTITLILLVVLRNLRDTLLVLLPLLLAGLYTAAATVVLHVPINFANIIALPLLFGLGVDSGVHMAHRLHYLHAELGEENLLTTSEAKGVFYGTLTTVFSFSSLAFTPHAGTASMGELLAIGLLFTLICSLVMLPAFSVLGQKKKIS